MIGRIGFESFVWNKEAHHCHFNPGLHHSCNPFIISPSLVSFAEMMQNVDKIIGVDQMAL